jgi:hypothetical protein
MRQGEPITKETMAMPAELYSLLEHELLAL